MYDLPIVKLIICEVLLRSLVFADLSDAIDGKAVCDSEKKRLKFMGFLFLLLLGGEELFEELTHLLL